jgi:hypothetical protein
MHVSGCDANTPQLEVLAAVLGCAMLAMCTCFTWRAKQGWGAGGEGGGVTEAEQQSNVLVLVLDEPFCRGCRRGWTEVDMQSWHDGL